MSKAFARGWSLDPNKWLALRAFLDGSSLSWNRTVLSHAHRLSVPAKPGVYAIEFPAPIQLGASGSSTLPPIRAPVYIGKSTTSIRVRFLSHTSDDPQDRIAKAREWPECSVGPRAFIWAELHDTRAIDTLESLLIDCFNPPCNKIGGARLSEGRPAGALTP
jgi:hypothetical protein